MNTKEWLEYYTNHPKDFDDMIRLAENTILDQANHIADLDAEIIRLTSAQDTTDLVTVPRAMVLGLEQTIKSLRAELDQCKHALDDDNG